MALNLLLYRVSCFGGKILLLQVTQILGSADYLDVKCFRNICISKKLPQRLGGLKTDRG